MELVKDERNVVRNGDQLTLQIHQWQVYSRQTILNLIKQWNDVLETTTEYLNTFETFTKNQLQNVDKAFEKNKVKYEEMLRMTEEQHLIELKKIAEQDKEAARNFLAKFDELKQKEKERMTVVLENIHKDLQQKKEETSKTLEFWNKSEYIGEQ